MTKRQAIRYWGSAAEVARVIGRTRALVSAWSEIPLTYQCVLEVASGYELLADRPPGRGWRPRPDANNDGRAAAA